MDELIGGEVEPTAEEDSEEDEDRGNGQQQRQHHLDMLLLWKCTNLVGITIKG